MSLEVQFQSLVASFLYGLVLGFGYGFFNRACFHLHFSILRWGIEIVQDVCWMIGYFFLIVYLNHGHFDIYLFLALIFGVVFYEACLAGGYLSYLEYLMRFFRWFFLPIHFIFSKIRAILRHVRKVINRGNKEKKKVKQR